MSQLSFFATGEDLLPICEDIEGKERVGYVEMGYRPKLDFPCFASAALIPLFGVASADSSISTTRYLILDKALKVNSEWKRIGDHDLIAVHGASNPEGIELTPGGVFKGKVLLSGRLATMGLTKRSNQLYRLFAYRIKKRFVRLGFYYVGAEAYAHLEQGWRLTDAVQSPARFDLQITAPLPVADREADVIKRKSYEDSCRQLQPDYVKAGRVPAMLDRMPQVDDEEPFGIQFFRMEISNLIARNLTLPRTLISRSKLAGTEFNGTDFTESNMCWNDFLHVDFAGAILAGCDMRSSIFQSVSFIKADLRGADLRRSTFEDCDFEGADMEGAKLDQSQLDNLPLSELQRGQIAIVEMGDEPPGG